MIKRLIFLGAVALVSGVGIRMSTVPVPAVARVPHAAVLAARSDAPTDGSVRSVGWKALWTRPTPNFVAMSLAPDGTNAAWVDKNGSVRRIVCATGQTQWQSAPLADINEVRVSGQGTVLAFSHWNPAKPNVRVLDAAQGERRSSLVPLDGAVWEAALAPNGKTALITTGKASLYAVPLRQDAVFPGVPVKLPGIAESVALAPGNTANAPLLLLGTWQHGGVCAWGMNQVPRWRHDERQPQRTYDVSLSTDGSTAIAVSSEGADHNAARLHVWDARTGKMQWVEDLGGFDARAAVSADGNAISVTWAQASSYSTGSDGVERRVALFGRDGRRKFADKGSHFFAPELVALSADGERLTVRDEAGVLWTLNGRGHTIGRLRLPAPNGNVPLLRETQTTPDGKYLLVHRGDGSLTLYQAVP